MNLVRWILAILSPVLAVALTFAMAVVLSEALERLCPPELMVSGVCTAAWYPSAELAAFSVAAVVGGFFFVVLPALIAPAYTRGVAGVALGAGAGYATVFLWGGGVGLLGPYVAAWVGGLAAFLWVFRRASASVRQRDPV